MTTSPVLHQPDTAATADACQSWFTHFERGPIHTRWNTLPVQTGDRAPSLPLVDARTGKTVELSETWSKSPALILFWRHFGCGCGRDRSARLIEEMNSYRPLGVQVTMICQGEPERAKYYINANKIPDDVQVLLDSEEKAYRAYGILDCGPLEVLFDAPDEYLRKEPESVRRLAKSRQEAGMPLVDNPWLLPGEFVVNQNGGLVYCYRYQYCENWVDPRVHIGAIRTAKGEFQRF